MLIEDHAIIIRYQAQRNEIESAWTIELNQGCWIHRNHMIIAINILFKQIDKIKVSIERGVVMQP